MKTQNEIRGKFEKLEDIANLIQEGNAFYCDKGDWYLCPNIDHSAIEMALDMAWYAFQEQQKKIDAIKKIMDADVYHIPTLIKDLKDILK